RSFSRASVNGCDPDISAGLLLYPVAGPLPAKPAPADLAPGLPGGALPLLMRRRCFPLRAFNIVSDSQSFQHDSRINRERRQSK
ncbi:MAG: hypothetical protein JSW45_00635, partial [Thiotrichales bacterium]